MAHEGDLILEVLFAVQRLSRGAQRVAEWKLKKKAARRKQWADYWNKNKETIKGNRRDR